MSQALTTVNTERAQISTPAHSLQSDAPLGPSRIRNGILTIKSWGREGHRNKQESAVERIVEAIQPRTMSTCLLDEDLGSMLSLPRCRVWSFAGTCAFIVGISVSANYRLGFFCSCPSRENNDCRHSDNMHFTTKAICFLLAETWSREKCRSTPPDPAAAYGLDSQSQNTVRRQCGGDR